MFKRKSKKPTTTTLLPPTTDDGLEDDLFSQLDAQEQSGHGALPNGIPRSATTLATTTYTESSQSTKLQKPKKDSKLRFKAREARKMLKMNAFSKPSDAVADGKLEQEARDEERDIMRVCDQLGLDMYEIQPDGHCLFAAVADQLALHGIVSRATASYPVTRLAAANYMLSHQNDFLPFLPSIEGEDGADATADGMMTPRQYNRYCTTIRDTAAWGGEPEILALSRAFNIPIHVVQAGKPPVVIHEPIDGMSDTAGTKVCFISYHRRMYGLGEHYNSLRPRMRVQPVKFMSVMH